MDHLVSVIVPVKNERGTIKALIERIPEMGLGTEIIFVEGGSADGTAREVSDQIAMHPDRQVLLVRQEDRPGKAEAVRQGFAMAGADILCILDGDLSVDPEDLAKFYQALQPGVFVNGSRMEKTMEDGAMRWLNVWANKFFAAFLSWILGQRISDSLCGSKMIWRSDWNKIKDHPVGCDPFGDFTLLFGAAKLGLTIIEVPVAYKARVYGHTQIRRFSHGLLLLRMTLKALVEFKLCRRKR